MTYILFLTQVNSNYAIRNTHNENSEVCEMIAQTLGWNGSNEGTSIGRPWVRAKVPKDARLINVDSL